MTFYKELGIDTYINAHDTYTDYGGSRMSDQTILAMKEAKEHFVDMKQLQSVLGAKIAKLTHNEGAFISNGAAGALTLTAAVCMVEGDMYKYSLLPEATTVKNEIIVIRCQRNAYDKAIQAAGAKIVEIGDADETLDFELEGKIGEKTAAVFYFLNKNFERASMPLQRVIEIAHSRKIPVVVDAAAQLPPVENLWNITGIGADLVLFSGGKTLAGPQDSGLIVGSQKLIEDCQRFGAPAHGICRGSKTSREAMVGLYVALEQYLALDQASEYQRLEKNALQLGAVMNEIGIPAKLCSSGPVGQSYPRIFGQCQTQNQAQEIAAEMLKRRIYIGTDVRTNQIYISPLNLTDEEVHKVGELLLEVVRKELVR
jgi:Selenocysteine synthase [seryl-tRNASer selenium transferase]